MTENIVDLEALYDDFYQRMVRIAASKQEFLNYLEPEDALQEAGLGWVLGVHAWVNSGRKVQGAGIGVKDAGIEEIIEAGLPVPYSQCPELEEFHKFLNGTIYKHLREVARKEYRYKKRLHRDEFDESFLAPDMSIEELLEKRENLDKEEWRLEVLQQFLEQPALMEKAGLTATESIIIYKLFHVKQTERQVMKILGIPKTTLHDAKVFALNKLRSFLS